MYSQKLFEEISNNLRDVVTKIQFTEILRLTEPCQTTKIKIKKYA